MSIFERFGSLYAVFTEDKALSIATKIKDKKISSITSGNFSMIYQYEITALINNKKLIIIKNADQKCNLYDEYKVQKEIFRCIKNNPNIRIPEPYGFLETSNREANTEQFMFMEYIEGKTLYRMLQEEFLKIYGSIIKKEIHEKDDISIDHIIKQYIDGFNEKQHIQIKFLTLYGELQTYKNKLSPLFIKKLTTLIEKIDVSVKILNNHGYSHNDLYQNPRNIIDNGTLIDFGLTTKHSGQFSTNDTLIIDDLKQLIIPIS